jgi:hypothetical protein
MEQTKNRHHHSCEREENSYPPLLCVGERVGYLEQKARFGLLVATFCICLCVSALSIKDLNYQTARSSPMERKVFVSN